MGVNKERLRIWQQHGCPPGDVIVKHRSCRRLLGQCRGCELVDGRFSPMFVQMTMLTAEIFEVVFVDSLHV